MFKTANARYAHKHSVQYRIAQECLGKRTKEKDFEIYCNVVSTMWKKSIQVGTQNPEFIYKKLCIYSYIFEFQWPSKCSLFDAIHLWRHFFYCSEQLWNSSILVPLGLLLFFVSPFLHQQNVSLWGLLSSRETNKQKSCWWPDWVNTAGGARGSCHFWSKTAEHSAQCGQVCL